MTATAPAGRCAVAPDDPFVRMELPIVLPDAPDARDGCVARLAALLVGRRGIREAHLDATDGAARLCVHYDPDLLSAARVEGLARAAGADLTGAWGHALLRLRAIDGEDGARGIEGALLARDGVSAASVSLAAQEARVEYERAKVSEADLVALIDRLGYAATPAPAAALPAAADHGHAHGGERGWLARNPELARSLASGALLLAAVLAGRSGAAPQPAVLALFACAYALGAWDLLRHGLGEIAAGSFSFDIDLLMLVAAAGAAAIGAYAEGAFLLFLFSLAHALEHYAMGKARNAISALADLAPPTARVVADGREVEVPVGEVRVGQVVLVLPGERVPTDGTVRSGASSVNQAPITGESVPVEKGPGAEVYAGTVNGEGALEVVTTRAAGDRTLDRVVRLVEEAQTQKAPTQRFTDRFARVYVPVVLVAVAALIVVPPLLGLLAWRESFYRGMTMLVAASPCALALGTPAAVLAGIAQAARRGVLIKGGEYLEALGTLRALALDKTGTLTNGRPEVTELVPLPGVAADELLGVAAAVERRSQHPLARAVVRRAEAASLALPEAGDLRSVTSRGVRSTVGGEPVEIGSLRLWQDDAVAVDPAVRAAVERLQADGQSAMAVRAGDRWLGAIGLADQPRPTARETVAELHALGVRPVVMLTGDHRLVGEAVGRAVGADAVVADLLPEGKVAAIEALVREHGQCGMVGDGVNDAPALARATVGIAMGGAGTAAALETADVALMADDLGMLPFAVGLSRRARGVIRQNVGIALAVIALLIVASLTGLIGIGVAVLLHEGSTLAVIANALRLLTYERR